MARPTDKGLISKSKLTAIGDAIRAKTGDTATMTPEQMAAAIANISGGGEIKQATGTLTGTTITVTGLDFCPSAIFAIHQSNERIGVYVFAPNGVVVKAQTVTAISASTPSVTITSDGFTITAPTNATYDWWALGI